MTNKQRLALAQEIFNIAYVQSESFQKDNIGADLAYLMGAVTDPEGTSFVDWRTCEPATKKRGWRGKGQCLRATLTPPALLAILDKELAADHPIWPFIKRD